MKKLFLLLIVSFISVVTVNSQTVPADFRKVVEKRLGEKKLKLANFCPVDTNVVARRVFKFTAMLLQIRGKIPPSAWRVG